VSLVFWTGRGVRQWRCRIMAQRPSRQATRGVLVVPDLAPDDPMRVLVGASGDEAGSADRRVARIVHELRTPLAAIQAYADLLREIGPAPAAHGYIDAIRQAAQHALEVVADLAPRARDEAAAHGLPLEPIQVGDLVRAAVEMVRPLALRAAAEITVVDAGRGRTALSHRRALTQVLINLLANAVRHAGAAPTIVVKTSLTRAGEVMIEVSDTGAGIPVRAVRIAAKGNGDVDGMPEGGMGLAISLQLAARAGARLEIGRAKRGGARVRVVLAGPAMSPVCAARDVAVAK
jgi:signal transduction histidine kinase